MGPHRVIGWRCAVCGATREIADPAPWRCPSSTADDRHHLLERVEDGGPRRIDRTASLSLAAHDGDLAWAAFASARGIDRSGRDRLVGELDDAVRRVGGVGFDPTPLHRSTVLSEVLGFGPQGGVWVKDETGGVAGSHKARHLGSIMLQLRAGEEVGVVVDRPPLAIASCGNAALAAATLARAQGWPLDVFVPAWMEAAMGARLDALGARIHRCARRPGDPPGDPAMLRFREAVGDGSVPFSVQGPENALCLDSGRTLGWEIAGQLDESGAGILDAVFVQVGGGALVSCLGAALSDGANSPRVHAVQAEGCAPLARAWQRAGARVEVAGSWDELMTAWDDPQSAADGILDDETYDWLGAFAAMRGTGGSPVVAPEDHIWEAHELLTAAGYPVSPTGAAGLAGLLTVRASVADHERVLVIASGVSR